MRPLHWGILTVSLVCLVLAGFAGRHYYQQRKVTPSPTPQASSTPSAGPALASLHISRSTNSFAYTMTIYLDGRGDGAFEVSSGQSNSVSPYVPRSVPAGTLPATDLKEALDAVGDLSTIPTTTCGKSVSVGTTTTITYKNQMSSDLQCTDNLTGTYTNLLNLVDRIETAFKK